MLLHGLDHGRRQLLKFHREHHSPAAHLTNLGHVDLTNALLEAIAGGSGVLVQALVGKHPQGGGAGGANERISREGAAVAPFRNTVADCLRCDRHPKRHSVRD